MAATYAVCDIKGWISLTDSYPAEGIFGLATGAPDAIEHSLRATAHEHSQDGQPRYRVPGTADDSAPMTNLGAIARYLRALRDANTPGVRPLGV